MTTPIADVRRRIKNALLAVRAQQTGRSAPRAGQSNDPAELARLLGLLLVGASGRGGSLIYDTAVGFGSEVTLEDLESGEWFRHRLMAAEAMELDAGHVSLESPLGSALLGCRPGDEISFAAPGGARRMCVARVETLPELLDVLERKGVVTATRAPSAAAAREPRTGTDG